MCLKFFILLFQCIRIYPEHCKEGAYRSVETGLLIMLTSWLLCVQWPHRLKIHVLHFKEGPDWRT